MGRTFAITRRMEPRDPDEEHRVSTPLELLVDLTFVVAVAQASASLHHALSVGHASSALRAYPVVFFGVWWAWMNFTWFASAYDTDDAVYRVATLVQMAGILVLAAGVPRAFVHHDFAVVVLGYVIMRIALVFQWLRASRHSASAATARRYAVGIVVCQVGWIAMLGLSGAAQTAAVVVLIGLELLVPLVAERSGATPWHPEHIAERYGLFTIIVLGESILAATMGVQESLDRGQALGDLITISAGGLLIVFSMWWIYFAHPGERVTSAARDAFAATSRLAFLWGYGHYVVYASAAAVGAGIAVAVDRVGGDRHLSESGAGLALAIPVVVYLLATWAVHSLQPSPPIKRVAVPVACVLVLIAAFLPETTLLVGLVLAGLIAVMTVAMDRSARTT